MENYTIQLFKKLASIPSPSGKEKEVASFIRKELSAMGIPYIIDGSGKENDSNSGNVIARLNGSGNRTVLFTAHMDTVAPDMTAPILKIDNGVIRSSNNTVMGADDKSSVSALLSALKELKGKRHPNVIAIFTTREEKGAMGIRFAPIKGRVDYAFVIDGQGDIGEFTTKALGQLSFEVTFMGKAAHAGHEPEKGRNAVKAAGLFISKLKLGKKADGTTLNLGTIQGGTANNVVPASAKITGEARAFEYERLLKRLSKVEKAAKVASKATGCKFILKKNTERLNYPFNSKNKQIIKIAQLAAEKAKIKFSISDMYATCEANILIRKGYNVIVMRAGYRRPHSLEENIRMNELVRSKNLILAISDQVLLS